jgi:hypothetical protein
MLVVNVSIVEFVEEHQPNFVKARLTDASGIDWFFVGKCPIFTVDSLDENSPYPLPGVIACQAIKREHDTQSRKVVTIDTEEPDHVEDTSGNTRFIVFAHQLSGADTFSEH